MIQALIPTIQQTKKNASRISGIINFGTVIATRSTGGVSAGRQAVLKPNWEPVGTLVDIPAQPRAGGVWRLASVDVLDGGDYDVLPIVRIYDAGLFEYEAATVEVVVSDRTISHVNVTRAGQYSQPGRVVAHADRRSYHCDVEIVGRGGIKHVFLDCIASMPLRVGDQVQVVSHPDNLTVAGVATLQLPRRPYIWTDPAGNAPVELETRHYRLARVSYQF